ncbi:methyltransferase domain-containing protein [Donghicola sp. C2-DW-16]|uniref:Methyltransferase domain-containing protein n=1 Tax=Donghicola mangrovi TaxID=2729614 RepID=A0ABX2PFY9_9RHOB|nr:class I SAM-dependent methyltransferase [Donghicola mangrovi]NVO27937.1 methyltransferase domain-containing protein [Donghicola mangrovi]
MTNTRTNWFDKGGSAYAQFRPEYPTELADYLAALGSARTCAVDVGCGTGQLTRLMAGRFDTVLGFDPSADQIGNAVPVDGVTYGVAPAEALPLPDHSADLITAAQAAHWFDLLAFWTEARRVAAPGGIVALISYGVLRLEDEALNARFEEFYYDEIGPFWPPERKMVDDGYRSIVMPLTELPPPDLSISLNWNEQAFLGYLSTWSATRRASEAGQAQLLNAFPADLSRLWPRGQTVRITWPLNLRIGRVD